MTTIYDLTNDISFQFEKMLLTCLKSGDELFHVALYDWLISKDLTDRLLEVCCTKYVVVMTTPKISFCKHLEFLF